MQQYMYTVQQHQLCVINDDWISQWEMVNFDSLQ